MLKIVNFSILSAFEKSTVENLGRVIHYGAALGIEQDPTEQEMIQILSLEQPDILIVNSAPVTAAVIDSMKNVKMIICARGNPVNVDVSHCKNKKILVTHTPGRNANGVAEYVIMSIILALRKIPQAIQAIRTHECTLDIPVSELDTNKKDVVWMHPSLPYEPYYQFTGNEMMGKILGLVGFGHIGKLVAQKAQALGMDVIVYDPYLPQEVFQSCKVSSVSFDDLLKQADVISLHAKAGDKPMIDKSTFTKMKKTAVLINTARSALIDNQALLKALDSDQIGVAVLDVFPYEPLSSFDPLLKPRANLILTPHIAGATYEVSDHQSKMVLEALQSFLDGKPIPYQA
ncbi:MAG: NAD(P)-dependent oxidoreductase [Brevinema sp.]